MIVRLIIAKVIHTRKDEFLRLVRENWAPLFEQHGGKFLGLFQNIEPDAHEVIGMTRFESREHLAKVLDELQHDERFQIVTAKMRPIIQSNEVRLIEPVQ